MPPPFNIDQTSPAASSLVSAFPANEQANRAEIEEWLTFISDPATGLIRDSVLPAPVSTFPAGTKMLFAQTAAPTGWTKDAVHNNKALRVVTGTASSGGSVAFTAAFASQAVTGTNADTTATGSNASVVVSGTTGSTVPTGTISNETVSGTTDNTTASGTVGGTAITTANLPIHSHSFADSGTTGSGGSHSHEVLIGDSTPNGDDIILAGWTGNGQLNGAGGPGFTDTEAAHTHSFSVSGTTGSTGSGTTHTHSFTGNAHNHTFTSGNHNHTFTGAGHTHSFSATSHTHTFTGVAHTHVFTGTAINLAVQYVDVIIATKDA